MANRALRWALVAQAVLLLYGLVAVVVKAVTVWHPGTNEEVIGSTAPFALGLVLYVSLCGAVGLAAYRVMRGSIPRPLVVAVEVAELVIVVTTAQDVTNNVLAALEFVLAVLVLVVLFVEIRKARQAAPTV